MLSPVSKGEICVITLHSGVSRGTERLVLQGSIPESEYLRMRCPHQKGDFPFPVQYGYALVGRVEGEGHPLDGKTVFALHPHQARVHLPANAVIVIPDNIAPRRAVLTANLETALNAVWDAGIDPGDRVLIVGAGVVGLLIARIAARIPGVEVTVCDIDDRKRMAAEMLGAKFAVPAKLERPEHGFDVAINTSVAGAGLQTCVDQIGPEGRVVEVSWYGTKDITMSLGGNFHAGRIAIVSSQVGQVPPAKAPRWDFRRRMATAVKLLDDPALDVLLTSDVPMAEAPDRLPDLIAGTDPELAITIRYPAADE